MRWNEVDKKWISKNKENLFVYFKTVTIPKFYTSKVFDKFNNLTIDDVEITGGAANYLTYGGQVSGKDIMIIWKIIHLIF